MGTTRRGEPSEGDQTRRATRGEPDRGGQRARQAQPGKENQARRTRRREPGRENHMNDHCIKYIFLGTLGRRFGHSPCRGNIQVSAISPASTQAPANSTQLRQRQMHAYAWTGRKTRKTHDRVRQQRRYTRQDMKQRIQADRQADKQRGKKIQQYVAYTAPELVRNNHLDRRTMIFMTNRFSMTYANAPTSTPAIVCVACSIHPDLQEKKIPTL